MFNISRRNPWPPTLDLTTVRETLEYMRDDLGRMPGLERVAAALDDALIEIEVAQREQKPAIDWRNAASTARFIPFDPRRS